MPYQLVVCPETAHLEMIEYETPSIGMLIIECSRFQPDCLGCPRTCAAHFDQREREARDRDRAADADDAGGAIDTAAVSVAPVTPRPPRRRGSSKAAQALRTFQPPARELARHEARRRSRP